MCVAARTVPAPPAHPLCRSQPTSVGVRYAVSPTRTGRKSVLCTVYASITIAIKPSCPPCDGAGSSSSNPGSGRLRADQPNCKPFCGRREALDVFGTDDIYEAECDAKVEETYANRWYLVASGGKEEDDSGGGGDDVRRAGKWLKRRELDTRGVFVRVQTARIKSATGPEKLLEVWFAPSVAEIGDSASPRCGLRKVDASVWEEMLDIVKCKVLSVVHGDEMDAYLLRSVANPPFSFPPHRLILKTCGTTLNLLGLPRILEIAATYANLPRVYRCFYSRKSFMFPERQLGPHRDWKHEVEFLDNIFPNGAAYTVGKVNGDHWLLYITGPPDAESIPGSPSSSLIAERPPPDYTIEILMRDLAPAARQPFFFPTPDAADTPSTDAQALSTSLGISDIFPSHLTTLDAYSFSPCGYSANALVKWGTDPVAKTDGEGYYTIHVTPEEGWSYASFECNVPLPPSRPSPEDSTTIPDLLSLIRRVVSIFQPRHLSLTLFISSEDNENEDGESAIEAAQRAFKAALIPPAVLGDKLSIATGLPEYKRTDKINYEFGGYDLAFASFELRS
ncbi:PPM-type phosphatase domain-containing protein [Mycena venus]|uniref:PPM-type phosphatase domain-containing protein n=1 Tax=Mycena venus TaxID=2733690 RepID=A0A8H6YQC9_9AGAR|nr:PPM-type phosphatase domain-containing protein [Mycena venus]